MVSPARSRRLWCLRLLCLLVVAVPGALLGACAEETTLTGSISSSHDLSFDDVELRLLTDQRVYELKYLKALDGGDNDIVARVVVDEPEGGVVEGAAIELGANAGRVDRVTAQNDPFPDLERGTLTFLSGATDDGAATTGEFATTFENGKTLNGTFSTSLTFASFDAP
jgi:hypothetical protein